MRKTFLDGLLTECRTFDQMYASLEQWLGQTEAKLDSMESQTVPQDAVAAHEVSDHFSCHCHGGCLSVPSFFFTTDKDFFVHFCSGYYFYFGTIIADWGLQVVLCKAAFWNFPKFCLMSVPRS